MSSFTVTPDAIRTVAGQVASGAAEIDNQRATLLAQIQGLGDSWQGSASQALEALYTRWDADVRALHQTLTEIGQQMNVSASDYEATEATQTSRFRA